MSYIFVEALWAFRQLFQRDRKSVYVTISVWCKKFEIAKAFFSGLARRRGKCI